MSPKLWLATSSPRCASPATRPGWWRVCARSAAGIEPKDFDVSTDARPERLLELFPAPGAWERISGGAGAPRRRLRGSGHLRSDATTPTAAARRGALRNRSAPGRAAPRLHHQRLDARSGIRRGAGLRGGQADLASCLLRAIGDPDVRFREDHLRLLRAIRFAARLGFRIEPATFEAIQRNHRSILRVSAERCATN